LLFKRFHVFIALSFKAFRLAIWSDELKGIITRDGATLYCPHGCK